MPKKSAADNTADAEAAEMAADDANAEVIAEHEAAVEAAREADAHVPEASDHVDMLPAVIEEPVEAPPEPTVFDQFETDSVQLTDSCKAWIRKEIELARQGKSHEERALANP